MSTGHTFSGMHCADMYAPVPHGCSLSPSPPALGSGGLLLGSPRTQAHCVHWQMPLPGSLWLNEKTLLNDYVPTLPSGLHSKVPSSLPSPQSQCPLISSILFFYHRQSDYGYRTHHLPQTKIIYYANEAQVLAPTMTMSGFTFSETQSLFFFPILSTSLSVCACFILICRSIQINSFFSLWSLASE